MLVFSIESMHRYLEDGDINGLIDGYIFCEIDGKDGNDNTFKGNYWLCNGI